jgi:hypothetical protein
MPIKTLLILIKAIDIEISLNCSKPNNSARKIDAIKLLH